MNDEEIKHLQERLSLLARERKQAGYLLRERTKRPRTSFRKLMTQIKYEDIELYNKIDTILHNTMSKEEQ